MLRLDPRAVAEIHEKILTQSKRNAVSRHFHAKQDKEKIMAWGSDLNRILHVFNVRSIISVWRSLILHSQTELAINTHVIVSDTHTMVAELRRTMVRGQDGDDGGNLLVSDTLVPPTIEPPLTISQAQIRSVSSTTNGSDISHPHSAHPVNLLPQRRRHVSDVTPFLSRPGAMDILITMLVPLRDYLSPKDQKSSPLLPTSIQTSPTWKNRNGSHRRM